MKTKVYSLSRIWLNARTVISMSASTKVSPSHHSRTYTAGYQIHKLSRNQRHFQQRRAMSCRISYQSCSWYTWQSSTRAIKMWTIELGLQYLIVKSFEPHWTCDILRRLWQQCPVHLLLYLLACHNSGKKSKI